MIKQIKLKVGDISCTGCIDDMENILCDQDGILSAEVNYAENFIDIQYDPDLIDRPAVIHAARRVANITEVISEESQLGPDWIAG